MVQLILLVFTLTFNELIVDLDAKICPKGQRVTRGRGEKSCEVCPDGYYQPEENDTQYCKACTKCNDKTGSAIKENCTEKTNTKCQCRGGYVPSESDSSTCRCNIGFGLKLGECSKCEDGYFSTRINSPCQKWKECKSGVNITGTQTSDVICNSEGNSNPYITTVPTSNKIVSLITRLTPRRPPPNMQTTTTTTITTSAPPGHTVPTTSKRQPLHPSYTGTYIGTGMTLLIFGIIGLLVLTAVTCKMHITLQPAVPKNDSLCRRPVEESGDGSLSSLKLNPGEH